VFQLAISTAKMLGSMSRAETKGALREAYKKAEVLHLLRVSQRAAGRRGQVESRGVEIGFELVFMVAHDPTRRKQCGVGVERDAHACRVSPMEKRPSATRSAPLYFKKLEGSV